MNGADASEHLRDTADVLWRPPFRWSSERAQDPPALHLAEEYVVVPNAAHPRLLLPTSRRVAARAVAEHRTGGTVGARLRGRVLQTLLRVGLGKVIVRDRLRVYGPADVRTRRGSITEHLGEVFDTPVLLSMPVTRARANRKPVLRVLDGTGTTLGFVKVGTNELTKKLVRREAETLTSLADHAFDTVELPRVVAAHSWEDLELLVLAPLPLTRGSRPPAAAAAIRAAAELGSVWGTEERLLVKSAYWHRLRERLTAAPDPRRATLLHVMERLDAALAGTSVEFGAWHGDWAPWNFAAHGLRVLVWDLERFETDVPLGLDAVHCDLQTRIPAAGRDRDAIILARLSQAATTLAPMGISPDKSPIIFAVYLVDIAARWLEDRQAEAGPWDDVLAAIIRSATEVASRIHVAPVSRGNQELRP